MPHSASRTIRDPLWQNVHLDEAAAAVVDTAEFQRLRRVKQLGFAHLVYPGAVHNRFLHALGVYHLTGRATEALGRKGHLDRLDDLARRTIPEIKLAALLHDVGHYAFSHAMEELEPEAIPGHHEEVADQFLDSPGIRAALGGQGAGAVQRIGDLIRGRSQHPLQGLVSGSLDLDKIDYLRRDSLFCGVPYGAVDVDRLLDSLTLARESEEDPLEVAVTEKGISALESLMFAKYQMFRNVYWHHAVRSATVVFRRLVEGALAGGILAREDLAGPTDEELLNLLGTRLQEEGGPRTLHSLLSALVDRRLPKRTIELLGDELPEGIAAWLPRRRDLVRGVEDRLAADRGLGAGTVFLDYPANPRMLELRLLLVRRRGEVTRLTSEGEAGLIDLPRLGRSLHHTTRVLRVFSLEPAGRWDPDPLLEVLASAEEDVEKRLEAGAPIYGSASG